MKGSEINELFFTEVAINNFSLRMNIFRLLKVYKS